MTDYKESMRYYSDQIKGSLVESSNLPDTGKLLHLFTLIKSELLVIGYSELLSKLYTCFLYKCRDSGLIGNIVSTRYYRLVKGKKNPRIDFFEAITIVKTFAKYLEDNIFTQNDLIECLNGFCLKTHKDADTVFSYFCIIDDWVQNNRERFYSQAEDVLSENNGDNSDSIMKSWQYSDYANAFSRIEKAIMETNQMFRSVQAQIMDSANQNYYSKLISIYHLISDTRQSILNSPNRSQNNELMKMAGNMDEFLALISEYLIDYGIITISSQAGSRFNSRTQRVIESNPNFDPRNAIIKKSICSGFSLGEQVIEKEIVVIDE